MAQKTVVLLEDDLDGSEAAETVRFALDGVGYELDLSTTNAAKLRAILGSYARAARRVGGRSTVVRKRTGGAPAKADREQLTAIRSWARGRGLEVNERGRIPRHVVEQYHAAAMAPPPPPPPPPVEEPPAPKRRRAAKKAE